MDIFEVQWFNRALVVIYALIVIILNIVGGRRNNCFSFTMIGCACFTMFLCIFFKLPVYTIIWLLVSLLLSFIVYYFVVRVIFNYIENRKVKVEQKTEGYEFAEVFKDENLRNVSITGYFLLCIFTALFIPSSIISNEYVAWITSFFMEHIPYILLVGKHNADQSMPFRAICILLLNVFSAVMIASYCIRHFAGDLEFYEEQKGVKLRKKVEAYILYTFGYCFLIYITMFSNAIMYTHRYGKKTLSSLAEFMVTTKVGMAVLFGGELIFLNIIAAMLLKGAAAEMLIIFREKSVKKLPKTNTDNK